MSQKLSDKQLARLFEIRDYRPGMFPLPAFWPNHPTHESLVRRGLIERVDHRSGVMTIFLCRITVRGEMAITEATK